MKHSKKRFLAFIVALSMVFAAAPGLVFAAPGDVTGIKILSPTLNVKAGTSVQLTAVITPADALDQNVTWSSSNPAAAAVNAATGLVTVPSTASGSVRITAKANNGVSTLSLLMITAGTTPGICAYTSNASLNPGVGGTVTFSIITYAVGNNTPVTASFDQAGATVPTITISNNAAKATASIPAGFTPGVHTVTFSCTGALGVITCAAQFTVPEGGPVVVPVSGVAVSPTAASLTVGGAQQLTAAVSPADATNKSVTWSSDNPAVATVDANGLVSAAAPGSANITVKTVDGGFGAICAVTVSSSSGDVPVTGISLDQTSLALSTGGSQALTASVSPPNASDKTVVWQSSDITVATVDPATGVVTAVGPGMATIYAIAVYGGFTASCAVTVTGVVIPVSDVAVAPLAATLTVGGTQQLTLTIFPPNATNKSVTWASGNASVATVDANGLVTAAGLGSANITVRTVDGGFSAICAITVSASVAAEAPAITAGPLAADYIMGETPADLSVTASVNDGGTLSYQWYSNTTGAVNPAADKALGTAASVTPGTAAPGADYYYCVVTNTNHGATASATSAPARVTVTQIIAPQLFNAALAPVSGSHPNVAAVDNNTVNSRLTSTDNMNGEVRVTGSVTGSGLISQLAVTKPADTTGVNMAVFSGTARVTGGAVAPGNVLVVWKYPETFVYRITLMGDASSTDIMAAPVVGNSSVNMSGSALASMSGSTVTAVDTIIRSISIYNISDISSYSRSDTAATPGNGSANPNNPASTIGRISAIPTANQFVSQIQSANGTAQTYAVYNGATLKTTQALAAGDTLKVTSQDGTNIATYNIALSAHNSAPLTGTLQILNSSIVAGHAADLNIDFYAGQRSSNANASVYIPAGVNATMDNTTVDLIGRGPVTLTDFNKCRSTTLNPDLLTTPLSAPVGRVAIDYPYINTGLGSVGIVNNPDGSQIISFTGLDLRPANGVDLRMVIHGVNISQIGCYNFKATYTASTSDGGPMAGASTGYCAASANLLVTDNISDFTRVVNKSIVYDKNTDYQTVSFTFTPPAGGSAALQASTDGGVTWNAISGTIGSGTAAVSGLTPNTLYSFRLNVTGGANPGYSNAQQFYSGMYNVKTMGGATGGTNDTPAVNKSIAFLNSIGGGTLEFPSGTYNVGTVLLKSNVCLYLDTGANLVATKANDPATGKSSLLDPENAWWSYKDYGSGTSDNNNPYIWPDNFLAKQDDGHCFWQNSMFYGVRLDNVKVVGTGSINGNGNLPNGDGTVANVTSAAAGTGAGDDKMFALKLCTNIELGGETNEGWNLVYDLQNDLPYVSGTSMPYYDALASHGTSKYADSKSHMLTIQRGGHFVTLYSGCTGVNVHDVFYGTSTQRDVFDFMETGVVSGTNIFVTKTSDDIIKPGSDCSLGYTKPAHYFNFRNVIGDSNCNVFQIGSETSDDIRDLYLDDFTTLGANKCGFSISTNDGAHVGNLHLNEGLTGLLKVGDTADTIRNMSTLTDRHGAVGTSYFERTRTPMFISISGRNRIVGAKYEKPSGASSGVIYNVALGVVDNIHINNLTMRMAYSGSSYSSSYYPYNPSSHTEFTSIIYGYGTPDFSSISGWIPVQVGPSTAYVTDVTMNNVSEVVEGYGTAGTGTNGAYAFSQTTLVPAELLPGKYNSPDIGVRPSYGYYIRHSKNITFNNCDVSFEGTPQGNPDNRYPIGINDADNIVFNNTKFEVGDQVDGVVQSKNATNVQFKNSVYAYNVTAVNPKYDTAHGGPTPPYQTPLGAYAVQFNGTQAIPDGMVPNAGASAVHYPTLSGPAGQILPMIAAGTTWVTSLDTTAKTVTVPNGTTAAQMISGLASANATPLTFAVTGKTGADVLAAGDSLVISETGNPSNSVTYTVKMPSMVTNIKAVSGALNIVSLSNAAPLGLTVINGQSVSAVLAAITSTDGSKQAYAITDSSDAAKAAADTVVTGDKLVVTAEDGVTKAVYAITSVPSSNTAIKLKTGTTAVLSVSNTAPLSAVALQNKTADDVLAGVASLDGSVQTYALTDSADAAKAGTDTVAAGDKLVVTAEDGVTTAVYTLSVSSGQSPIAINVYNLGSSAWTTSGPTAITTAAATAPATGNYVQLNATCAVGTWLQFALPSVPAGTYDLSIRAKERAGRATVQVSVDGADVGAPVDLTNKGLTTDTFYAFPVGRVTFPTSGTHTLRMTVTVAGTVNCYEVDLTPAG